MTEQETLFSGYETKPETKEREYQPSVAEIAAPSLGGYRTTDPPTSRSAAFDNYPRSGTQRFKLFAEVVKAGERGRTTDEAMAPHGLAHQSASRRMTDLIEGGWIEATGETRPSRLGSQQQVYVATAKGVDAWMNSAP